MSTVEVFLNNAQTQVGGVFVLSCLIIIAYIVLLRQVATNAVLQAHFLAVTALMILMPILLFLAVTATINKEAVASLLGVIVGYFFQRRES